MVISIVSVSVQGDRVAPCTLTLYIIESEKRFELYSLPDEKGGSCGFRFFPDQENEAGRRGGF